MGQHCEYCGYLPCGCGGRVHKTLYGEVPKYSKEWWKENPSGEDAGVDICGPDYPSC